MLEITSLSGVEYQYDPSSLAALTVDDQFRVTSIAPRWVINTLNRLVDPNEPGLEITRDRFSPATAGAFIRDANASLLARINVADSLSPILVNELSLEFQQVLWRIGMCDDESIGVNAFDPQPNRPFSAVDDSGVKHAIVQGYRRTVFALAEYEGIDGDLLIPPCSPDEIPWVSDLLPITGIELLRWVGNFSAKKGAYLPEHLKMLLPLAEDLQTRLLEIAKEKGSPEAYVQFVLGPDLTGKQAELAFLNPESAAKFNEQLPHLFTAAAQLQELFPPEFAQQVHDSFLQKTVACVYGYVEHELHNRHLNEPVTLGDDFHLPCELSDDEPFTLIDNLIEVIAKEHALHQDPYTRVVRAILRESDAGFQLYRLIQGDRISSVYLRPWGSGSFDRRLEYGRNGEGVEASIGRIMKLDPGYLPLGKAAAHLPDTISVRLDREGLDPLKARNALVPERDPTREIGSLALDIGSVLGPENNFGVKVGRFLAVCDAFRSRKISPETSTLNHVAHPFAPSRDREFAALVMRMAKDHDRRESKASVKL